MRDFQIFNQANASISLDLGLGLDPGLICTCRRKGGPDGISPDQPLRIRTVNQARSILHPLTLRFVDTPTAIRNSPSNRRAMVNTDVVTPFDNIWLSGVDTIVSFTDGDTTRHRRQRAWDFVIVGNVEYMSSVSAGYYQYSIQRPPPALQDPRPPHLCTTPLLLQEPPAIP